MFWDFLFPHNEIFEIDFLLSIGLQDQIAAHNKKKCTKHNICWNQTEIEKGPTKKKKKHWVKKYESSNWSIIIAYALLLFQNYRR